MDRYIEAFATEMKMFCNAVIKDLPLKESGNGLVAVAVALATKKSLLENRPVKLTEIL